MAKKDKLNKELQPLEAARLGHVDQLETYLSGLVQLKSKKKSNPLASLRRTTGLNSVRDSVTGFTCLHHAALNGHIECVQLLLDYGAKINALDYKGSTALHLASWAGNLDVVKILLAFEHTSGPSTKAPGDSPPSVKYQSLDIDLCNNDNQTAISLAAQFGHTGVVAELLAYRANINIRNNQLESPLDLACFNGRLDTVNLLLKLQPHLIVELRKPCSSIQVDSLNSQQNLIHNARPQSLASSSSQTSPTGRLGWSTLLGKGRRETIHGNQSPINRLTGATSSMRQARGQNDGSSPGAIVYEDTSSRGKRRATLAIGNMSLEEFEASQKYSASKSSNKGNLHPFGSEKLLDHSPLHYAVRRGHSSIINLLLYTYGANPLQITARGSVLHEVAVNKGRHVDIIGLFFAYIENSGLNNLQLLDQFLSLVDCRGRTVINVLDEINNRSAQDIKRLIHDFTEQVRRNKYQVIQQQQHQNFPMSHERDLHLDPYGHINSFVTMKRMPKNQRPQAGQNIEDMNNLHLDDRMGSFNATQTIDRRSRNQRQQTFDPDVLRQIQNSHYHHQQQQQQQQQLQHRQDQMRQAHWYLPTQPTLMTRSVSNLNKAQSQCSYNGQQDVVARKSALDRRNMLSKSRDLGSILMGGSHERSQFIQSQTDPSIHPEAVENWASMSLVRSQTDCSHLINRLYPMTSLDNNGSESAKNQHRNERKMINRHYHVYDHEFYPPRLIDANHNTHNKSSMKPPRVDHSRSSQRSTVSSQLSNQKTSHNIGNNQNNSLVTNSRDHKLSSAERNNRLSVDANTMGRRRDDGGNLHNQMANPDEFAPDSTNNSRCDSGQPSMEERRQHLIELQKRIRAQSLGGIMNQARCVDSQHSMSIHESHSLESRLSESQLAQAPTSGHPGSMGMAAKYTLIGAHIQPNQNGSMHSMLTGVSLDLDRQGDRLTICGTALSPSSGQSHNLDLDSDEFPEEAPPKPPRNSLVKNSVYQKQTTNSSHNKHPSCNTVSSFQADLGQRERAVIYDVPQVGDDRSDSFKPKRPPPAPKDYLARYESSSQSSLKSGGSRFRSSNVHTEQPPPRTRPPAPRTSELSMTPGNLNLATSPLQCVTVLSSQTGSTTNSSPGSTEQILQRVASIGSNERVPGGPGVNGTKRMSSGTACEGIRRYLSLSVSGNDLDSGVCTSNSPASLSHDSETVSKESTLTKIVSEAPDNANEIMKESGKGYGERPSNLLEIRDSHSREMMNCPPSPNTAQMRIQEALMPIEEKRTIDFSTQATSPLLDEITSVATSSTKDLVDKWLNGPSSETDYENCQSLQENLQMMKSTKSSRVRNSGSSPDDLRDDEGDYACSPNRSSSSVSTTSASLEIIDVSRKFDITEGQNEKSSLQRRELTVKIVMDANEEVNKGDVFYIDPSELKRIASGTNEKHRTDAETMTDDELSAAIDEDSGLIKFVLRKRRNDVNQSDQINQKSQVVITGSTGEIDEQTNKKTRLNSHLDGSCRDKIFNTYKPHRHATTKLKQWFKEHLVVLADYADILSHHGFDNIKFLNHPRLISDKTLASIGINDDTHRLLILDKLGAKLPLVDMRELLDGDCKTISPMRILQALEMDHLVATNIKVTHEHLVDLLERDMNSTNMTIGYENRLALAIEHISNTMKPLPVDDLQLEKETSLEVDGLSITSTEIDMIEAGDSSTPTSSSSSKESIKSIVMQKSIESKILEETHGQSVSLNPGIKKESVEQASSHMPRQTSSLVGEVARRIEAANAKVLSTNQKPVAATRRSSAKILVQDSARISAVPPRQPQPNSSLKSVCWPPKGYQQPETYEHDIKPGLKFESRISASRQLFEKASEDNANKVGPPPRPRPALPAKPAKLVASKINTEITGQSS